MKIYLKDKYKNRCTITYYFDKKSDIHVLLKTNYGKNIDFCIEDRAEFNIKKKILGAYFSSKINEIISKLEIREVFSWKNH